MSSEFGVVALSENEYSDFMAALDPSGTGQFNLDSYLKLMAKILKESMNEKEVNDSFRVTLRNSHLHRNCIENAQNELEIWKIAVNFYVLIRVRYFPLYFIMNANYLIFVLPLLTFLMFILFFLK
jgi:hypothetical protein